MDGPASPSASGGQDALFEEATERLGIGFVHDAGRVGRYLMPEMVPPGASLFDYDGDGDLDLYLVNSGQLDDRGQPVADVSVANRLYRQNEAGRFEDVSAISGLADSGYGMGVACGDINNDGFPDLYLSNLGPDRLFLNNRDGTFSDVTAAAGIDNSSWSTSVAMVDFDRDGWLDLYVTNYVDYRADTKCPDNSGRPDYCGPQVFDGRADRLYRNLGGEVTGGTSSRQPVSPMSVSRRESPGREAPAWELSVLISTTMVGRTFMLPMTMPPTSCGSIHRMGHLPRKPSFEEVRSARRGDGKRAWGLPVVTLMATVASICC